MEQCVKDFLTREEMAVRLERERMFLRVVEVQALTIDRVVGVLEHFSRAHLPERTHCHAAK